MYQETGTTGFDWTTDGLWGFLGVLLLIAVVSYFMGNINPSLIQAKMAGINIRKEGSGNPGTTNTLRVLGKKAAVITLFVDILKGVLAVVLAGWLFGEIGAEIAAPCVFVGHVFPVIYGFKGGKGVATAFGALAALHPAIGFGCLGVVILAVLITRYVSFGSIFGAIAAPILSAIFLPGFVAEAFFMAAIVIYRHKDNIVRLIHHEENKLSFSKKKDTKE